MLILRSESSVFGLALLALACAPKHTAEMANQRFVTEANAAEVSTAAAVFRTQELSIVAATPMYVCAEQSYSDIRWTPVQRGYPGESPAYDPSPTRGWRLLRVAAEGGDGTTRVTVTPSPSFLQGLLVRFLGESKWLEDEEARRAWCEDPRGEDTPIAEEQLSVTADVASQLKQGLSEHES